jgi:hypothetical protein
MTAKEFEQTFPNELACRDFWKTQREKAGITCSRCKCTDHYWHHWNQEWRCRKCKKTTTLRSGTVMMHSNLPLLVWFRAMFEVMSRKKSISATELYRQFPEIKSEGTAWYLLHRLRVAMGYRDQCYQLEGDVEIDEAFITVVKKLDPRKKESKRGRGSLRKCSVLVFASTTKINPDVQKRNRPASLPRFFKMIRINDQSREEINEKVFRNVKARTHAYTDMFPSYTDLKDFLEKHTAKKMPPTKAHIDLPWVHCAIGNCKRNIDGIHHHVHDNYLQNYLDEFIFKLNRRHFKDPFYRLFNACLAVAWG